MHRLQFSFCVALIAFWCVDPAWSQVPVVRKTLPIECAADTTYGLSAERLAHNGGVVLRGSYADELVVDGSRLSSRGLVDGFLCGVDEELRLNWVHTFGGPGYDAITCAAPLADGGLAVSMLCGAGVDGFTTYRIGGTTFSGRGGADAAVFVLNADGSVRWVRVDGAFNAEYPLALTIVNDSLIVVAGVFVKESRFGSEVVFDSCEISAYLQGIDLLGNHKWVRVVRGAGLGNNTLAVRMQPLHLQTSASLSTSHIRLVMSSSEGIAWADTMRVAQDAELYGTTAILTADVMGNAVSATLAATCVDAQTVFGMHGSDVGAVAAEYISSACAAVPFDVFATHPNAEKTRALRVGVDAPYVKHFRNTSRGTLAVGSTGTQPFMLATDNDGFERWRYIYATPAPVKGTIYDALETDTSIIAVVQSSSLALLLFDVVSGVDDTLTDNKSVGDARMHHLRQRLTQLVYNHQVGELLQDGFVIYTLAGRRLSAADFGTLASQPILLTHTDLATPALTYFCR